MKIENVLKLYEELLFEISKQAKKNVRELSQEDYNEIRAFLNDVIDYAEVEDIPVEQLSTRRVVNLLQKTHGDNSNTTVLPNSSNTIQNRAYAFGDDDDRRVKTGTITNKIYGAIVDALRDNGFVHGSGFDTDGIAIIRGFLGKSGTSNIHELVNNPTTFSKAIANHQHKSDYGDREDDATTRSGKALDANSFVFLVSIKNKQVKQKQKWDDYVNPEMLKNAAETLGLSKVDRENALRDLIQAGFITKSSERGYHPDLDKIDAYRDHILSIIESCMDAGKISLSATANERGSNDLHSRNRESAKNAIALKSMVREKLPADIVSNARRKAVSILQRKVQEDQDISGMGDVGKQMLSIMRSYQSKIEKTTEVGKDMKDPMLNIIENTIEQMTLKIISFNIINMLKKRKAVYKPHSDWSVLKRRIKSKYGNGLSPEERKIAEKPPARFY